MSQVKFLVDINEQSVSIRLRRGQPKPKPEDIYESASLIMAYAVSFGGDFEKMCKDAKVIELGPSA